MDCFGYILNFIMYLTEIVDKKYDEKNDEGIKTKMQQHGSEKILQFLK